MRTNRIKKAGMSFAALAVIAAVVLPVSAAENTQKGDLNVQAVVKSDYTLTVPKEIVNIPFEQVDTELNITVSGNIEKGKTISVTTEKNGILKTAADSELPYTIGNTQLIWSDTELDNVGEIGVKKTTTLTITQESWRAAKAGDYSGTVTFTANLKEI